MKNVLRAVAGIALLSVAACTSDGVGPSGSGLLEVQLSGGVAQPSLSQDGISMAPPGSENIASATIEIGAVELVTACADSSAQDDSTGDGDGDCEFVTVTDSAGAFDLMDFQNGLNASLGTATVPAGTYTQIRLHVLSASVTLVDGVTFPDSSSTADLIVPSGAQSGIKINLSDDDDEPGLTVGEGEFVVLLELDVSRNFVLTGPPGSPLKCLFTPVVRQVTGE
jgi:hypothetical protein